MSRDHSILSILLISGLLTTACDDGSADLDNSEVTRTAELFPAEAAPVTELGVRGYAVTREAGCSRVALRDGDAAELGTLVTCAADHGALQLALSWRGRTTEFTVDTTRQPAPLEIRSGERTAVVLEGELADPLFEQVQGEWQLARAVFRELDLAPGLLERLDQQAADATPLYSEDLALSSPPAADGGCPNICHQGGCAWVFDQYCHTAPLGNGQCVVGFCGCGDC